MMNRRASILLLTLLATPAHAGQSEDLEYTREARAWNLLIGIQEKDAPAKTIRLLERFIQTFPKGRHISDAQFALAEAHFKGKDFPEALPYYQTLVEDEDSRYYFDSWLRVGEIQYNTGDVAQAKKTWGRLADKSVGKSLIGAEALYGAALCEMQEQRFLEAIHVLDKLLKAYPAYKDLPKVRELLGILRFNEKDYKAAVESFDGVETAVALFYRGLSHFHQKQYQEAAQSFNNLSRMPSSPHIELGLYLRAECFRLAQNHALAAKAYDDFVAGFPKSSLRPQAMIHQARALNGIGEPQQALNVLAALRKGELAKDFQVEALYLETEIAAMQGDYKKASTLPNKVLEMVSKDQLERYTRVYAIIGYYLLKMGKEDEAAAAMKGLVQKMPQHPLGVVAHILTGNQATRANDWKTALNSYESALLKYEYTPLSDVAMAMMLSTYFRAGKFQELVTNANRVLGVVASEYAAQDVEWRAQSHLLLAEAYYRLKLYADASRHYEQAMKEPNLAAQSRFFLAWSKYHEGKYADSLRLAQQVLAKRRLNAAAYSSAHFLVASSQFNQKEYAAAAKSFQSFRDAFPSDPRVAESFLHEGWAHRQAGSYGRAIDTWKALGARFPKAPLAQEGHMQIGKLYFQGREFQNAAKTFGDFLVRWPHAPMAAEAQWLLGQTYYNNRQDGLAVKAYETFLARYASDERAGDAKTQLMQARYRQASEAKDAALLAQFVAAYPATPLASEAQYQLAQMAYEAKDWARCTELFRKFLLEFPGAAQAPMALLAVAHAQEHLKKPEAAAAEYKSLLDLFPGSPEALDGAMRLGAIYFAMEKFREAAESFRFVADREAPKEVKSNALYNMGVAFKKQRSYSEAVEAFDRHAKTYPEDPRQMDALLEIAAIEKLLDHPEQAVKAYQRVLARQDAAPPVKMEIHGQIAELFRGSGNKEKAIESYARLIPMTPAKEDARLLGLAQLAAIYEEQESWEKSLEVYGHIEKSGGKAEWVQSAAKRAEEIKSYLNSRRVTQAQTQDGAKSADPAKPAEPDKPAPAKKQEGI